MAHTNGTVDKRTDDAGCCEPKVWLYSGLFPVEFADPDAAGQAIDPFFDALIERLWKAVLRDPEYREAYRRYRPLPEVEVAVESFGRGLSLGELKRFLRAAGIEWDAPAVAPTCAHEECIMEWLATAAEWRLPVKERLRRWAIKALTERVSGQSWWPTLDARAAGQPWPYPRPLPWEAGDGR
jgi:hypothetical protein